MRKLAIALLFPAAAALAEPAAVPPAPNGISLPADYKDWKMIGVSSRIEQNNLRAILGNDLAVKAAREGKTNPWPDGAILVKLSWKKRTHELFPSAEVPGDFTQADFMVKDAAKYASTGGWGYARWLGLEQKPYGANADFAQECVACHSGAKAADYVFTHPAKLP